VIVGVHADNVDSEKKKVLQKVFQSDHVKKVIEEAFPYVEVLW
jgi:ABC-type metal ion transport system substrate-binding protein